MKRIIFCVITFFAAISMNAQYQIPGEAGYFDLNNSSNSMGHWYEFPEECYLNFDASLYDYVWIKFSGNTGRFRFGLTYSEWKSTQAWGETYYDTVNTIEETNGISFIKIEKQKTYEYGINNTESPYKGDSWDKHIRDVWVQDDGSMVSVKIESVWFGTADELEKALLSIDNDDSNNISGKVAEIIDLGLSVKWASWNIGAEKPEGLGDLYAWGELSPKTDYSNYTYKFYNNGYTKYGSVDGKYRLDSEDDVAKQKWGDNWRIPTYKELEELNEKCTFTQTEINGVPVTKVVGPNGNFIYFPYPGNYTDATLYFKNSVGSYWSSDLESDSYAKDIDFYGMPSLNGDTRYHGQSIRPVYAESTNDQQNNDNTSKLPGVVDLGLSSGTLWAAWNIGASSPEEYGDYFAWGETAPKSNYDWSSYKFGVESSLSKYNSSDGLTELELEDDAAYVILGKDWRMPTHKQELELANECSWESTTINGISGYKITGPNGNSIFMPRGGLYDGTDYDRDGTSLSNVNTCGWYWSTTLNNRGSAYAQGLCFFPSLLTNVSDHERCDGHNIRPIYVGEGNNNGNENNNNSGEVAEIVDLGLSVKWASWNVGAKKPEGLGNMYAWGELSPKTDYSTSTYKFYNNGYTKYGNVDGKYRLDAEDDVAKQEWGDGWRIPTYEELTELKEKCTFTQTELNGVSVTKVVGPNGNFIYFPYPGNYTDATLYFENSVGSYWSSDLESDSYARDIDFMSGMPSLNGDSRYHGQAIRPVYGQKSESSDKVADIVDLGLSVKWASWNVGAEKPEGLGDLYAWGELSPKTDYSTSTYKFYNNGYTKYGSVDGKYRLDSEDDVAQQKWGDNWRIPTYEELEELNEKCTFTKTELNGVPVTKVVGPNGNYIYFPYPGNYTGSSIYFKNSVGSYWSSDLETDSYAKDIDYLCGMPSLNGDSRDHGQAIRPVYGSATTTKCVIHLETAGTLAEKISSTESGKILDLKITGHMDARDFDFIKWHCMKVENVDISGVKIEAYTGADGTNEGYDYTYAANEIPLGAFFYWTTSNKYNYDGMPSDEGMPSLKKIKLPDGIKNIRRNAFARAYNLTEINIPEGVETIDYVAFAVCTSLSQIILPSSLKEVGTTTFADMTSLRTVYIYATNPPTCSDDAFMHLSNDAVLFVPKGTKSSYQSANGWNTFKTIMEIGEIEQVFEIDGIKYKIGENNTVSVTSKTGGYSGEIVIPAQVNYNGTTYSVTNIETNALEGCTNLQVLIIPQIIYEKGIPEGVPSFVTYSKEPMRVEVKSKGAISAVLNLYPINGNGVTTVTMLGQSPGQYINWKMDDENYGIISEKTNATLSLVVLPALPTSTTKAKLCAIVDEADDDLHYGFEWLRNDAPEGMPSNVVSVSLYNGRIAGSLGGLNPDIYYKYRPFYKSDSGEVYYGDWIPFLTGDANVFFEPEIHTKEAKEITQMSAQLAGIWIEGTEDVESKGFEYWIVSNNKTRGNADNDIKTVTVNGNKTTANINGLAAGREYCYRSFAKTASGTVYGEEMKFKTNLTGSGSSISITINSSGKNSYTTAEALDFSGFDDLKAYVATGYEGSGTIWLTRVKQVPANTPILIKGEADETYDVPVIDKCDAHFENMFQGSADNDVEIDVTSADGKWNNYYMASGSFKKVTGKRTIGKGKCYLQLPASFKAAKAGEDQTVKIADSGKSSYAPPVDIDLTDVDGLKAYAATGYDAESSTIWLTRINKIQAGEGVMLKGEGGKTYTLPSVATQAYYGNMMIGNIGDAITINESSDDGEWTNFYLASGSFKKVNGTREIGTNKSYLQLPTSLLVSSARGKNTAGIEEWLMEELETETILLGSIGGEDGDGTTRINAIANDNAQPDVYYNLQGQRINNPKKGLYIKNGKKVVIRSTTK